MTAHNFLSLEKLLTLIGACCLLWLLLRVISDLGWKVKTYVLSEVWRGVELSSYGPWAVVTGATSGIGKAYAHELAKRGLNIVLISRSLEKLNDVATEIGERHGRSTRIIQADFTRNSELYEPIQAALQGLEIGILVNNVGMNFSRPSRFLSTEKLDKFIDDMVHCNMLSTVKMTQIILPQMIARKKGIIINISSGTARRPFPFSLLYAATKTFLDNFSQGLELEYHSSGIIVQTVLPLFVATNMTSSFMQWFMAAPESFARNALNTVGIAKRTSGCLSHSFQLSVINIFYPSWLQLSPFGVWLTRCMMKLMVHK